MDKQTKTASTKGWSSTERFEAGKSLGAPVTSEAVFGRRQFETIPAKVNVSFGLTLNLGNYEAARVDVGIEIPCYPDEAEQAYNYAHDWVEKKVQAEVDSVRKSAK